MSTTWKHEVDQDRYWESKSREFPTWARTASYLCPTCGQEFANETECAKHIGSVHAQSVPVLMFGDAPAPRRIVIRAQSYIQALTVRGTEQVRVSKNGDRAGPMSSSDFFKNAGDERDALYKLWIGECHTPYELTIAIADPGVLKEIDRIFIEILAVDRPSMTDVQRFGELCKKHGDPAVAYVDALADYVIGLIIKDHDLTRGASLPFEHFKTKLQRALNVLREHLFDRHNPPVPETVCACIRLNLNEFSYATPPSGVPLLDSCLDFFTSVCDCREQERQLASLPNSGRSICPMDAVTHEVADAFLALCGSKAGPERVVELLKERAMRGDLSEYDRSKMQVLLAIALRRIRDRARAERVLLSLSQDQTFGQWAESQLRT